jgi:hypothetical protein
MECSAHTLTHVFIMKSGSVIEELDIAPLLSSMGNGPPVVFIIWGWEA